EALVTSTPLMIPAPPGVTYAKCECGTIAICGYWPLLRVTCAWAHGGVVCAVPARQVCESLFRSSKNPTFAVVGVAFEEYATIAMLVSASTRMEYGSGKGEMFDGSKPASEIVSG